MREADSLAPLGAHKRLPRPPYAMQLCVGIIRLNGNVLRTISFMVSLVSVPSCLSPIACCRVNSRLGYSARLTDGPIVRRFTAIVQRKLDIGESSQWTSGCLRC